MKNVVSLVLGGGKGTRLYPLTRFRSKPAVPLAGKYRLIDIPISNCLNSNLNQIYLLTQFNSVSLHRHIRQTYKFDRFSGGFVEILAAQQTNEASDWYQGTADAVRKNLRYLKQPGIDYVAILSGDQLYRMNFNDMIASHVKAGADATIAAIPVNQQDATGFGIMQIDDSGRINGFVEKPQTDEELKSCRTEPGWLDNFGLDSKGRDYLASMGIYLFNRDVLVDLLETTDSEDFGKEIFPMSIKTHQVHIHPFDGYWEDIGTIRSYYDANLALASDNPPFELFDEEFPIYSRARFLPPSRINGASIKNSLIADGCVLGKGTVIENSVIGLRCQIGENVTIKDSIIMGNDYFQAPPELRTEHSEDDGKMLIGEGTVIENAIVDKNTQIGKNATISPKGISDVALKANEDIVTVQDEVVVIQSKSHIPDGWNLSKP
jgi:glucose-1-phosphate adenylyltransferase